MKFHFRFDSLLRHRRYGKELAQCELAKAEQAVRQARSRCDRLHQQILSLSQALEENQSRGMDTSLCWHYQKYLHYLQDQLTQARSQQRQAEKALEQRRLELLERERACKMLEVLSEKDEARFRCEQKRLEQKVADEAATLRFMKEHGHDEAQGSATAAK